MKTTDIRIQEALHNAEQNIAYLATMPDKKLEEKLGAIHLQAEIAIQKKITSSVKLLEIWRSQVIAARIYKAENNIADVPNKIDEALAEMDMLEQKAEERKKLLQQPKGKTEADSAERTQLAEAPYNPTNQPSNFDEQLSLF